MKDREAREQISALWRRIISLREELGAAKTALNFGPISIPITETRNLGSEIGVIRYQFDALLEYLGLVVDTFPAPFGQIVIRKQKESSARKTR